MVRAHKSASDGRYGWNGRYGTDFHISDQNRRKNWKSVANMQMICRLQAVQVETWKMPTVSIARHASAGFISSFYIFAGF
ncbi:unnamed protein product [Callosobruchus maculatus]|uniref:Uncharacterized protein n=1 Tax=Callosobruchus maculatus TaxID=64391 RepID=A0A653BT77_CALMS|nr:unnamed protein product [Callosobruchus maculatus]